jgi:hypothetical protein
MPVKYGLSMEDYLATDAASSTVIRKLLSHSPAHAKVLMDDKGVESQAFKDGKLIHTLVLEPHLLNEKYFIAQKDGIDYKTKEGKLFKQEAEEAGLIPVKREVYMEFSALAEAIMSHANAKLMPQLGKPEASLFWTDADTGVNCKSRPDWLWEDQGILFDLKTTEDARDKGFQASIASYGYHLQAAMALDGYQAVFGKPAEAYIWVVVEKKAPYGVNTFRCTPELARHGRKASLDGYKKGLVIYNECKKTGIWNGYSEEIKDMLPPYWMTKKEG